MTPQELSLLKNEMLVPLVLNESLSRNLDELHAYLDKTFEQTYGNESDGLNFRNFGVAFDPSVKESTKYEDLFSPEEITYFKTYGYPSEEERGAMAESRRLLRNKFFTEHLYMAVHETLSALRDIAKELDLPCKIVWRGEQRILEQFSEGRRALLASFWAPMFDKEDAMLKFSELTGALPVAKEVV